MTVYCIDIAVVLFYPSKMEKSYVLQKFWKSAKWVLQAIPSGEKLSSTMKHNTPSIKTHMKVFQRDMKQ